MMLLKKFNYGIFDVDGTLFDNIDIITDAFWKIIKKLSLPKSETLKIYRETNGMNLNDQFKLIFDKYSVKYDNALINKLNKKYFDLRDNWKKWQNAPLFSGTKSLLKTLRANNIKLFISSGSNTNDVAFRLQKAGILEYFTLVMGAEKIPKGPEHYNEFAAYCQENIQDFTAKAFLISDGPNDMALAKNANMFAVGITNTIGAEKLKAAGANLIIKNFKELNH